MNAILVVSLQWNFVICIIEANLLIRLTYSRQLDYAPNQTHCRNAKVVRSQKVANLDSENLMKCMYCYCSCQVRQESQTYVSGDHNEFDLFGHLECPMSEPRFFLCWRGRTDFFRREEETGSVRCSIVVYHLTMTKFRHHLLELGWKTSCDWSQDCLIHSYTVEEMDSLLLSQGRLPFSVNFQYQRMVGQNSSRLVWLWFSSGGLPPFRWKVCHSRNSLCLLSLQATWHS